MQVTFHGLLIGFRSTAIAFAAVGIVGCAQVYDVRVDAIARPEAMGGRSFRIVAKQPALETSDPHYLQAAQLVRNALEGHGMYEAPRPEDADVVVEIDYGVGPQRTKIRSEGVPPPMTGTMAAQQAILGPPSPLTPGTVVLPDGRLAQPLGSEETLEAYSVFDKHLSISARENTGEETATSRGGQELWRVDVSVEDEKTDLATVLPIMAGAAADYIGSNTDARESIRVSEEAKAVAFVKGQAK